MYIPEFWCGVLAVIGVEVLIIFVYVVYVSIQKGKKK